MTTSPTNNLYTVDQQAYKIAIENLALTNDPYIFDNKGPEHAAIVLGNIFKTAKNSIEIFSGDFNRNVSDNPYFVEGLECFLQKDKPLSIVFENEPNEKSLALSLIKKKAKGSNCRVSIRRLKDGSTRPVHFTTADGLMFRLETSKEDFTALCSFNNKDISTKLENIFSQLWDMSDEFKD